MSEGRNAELRNRRHFFQLSAKQLTPFAQIFSQVSLSREKTAAATNFRRSCNSRLLRQPRRLVILVRGRTTRTFTGNLRVSPNPTPSDFVKVLSQFQSRGRPTTLSPKICLLLPSFSAINREKEKQNCFATLHNLALNGSFHSPKFFPA